MKSLPNPDNMHLEQLFTGMWLAAAWDENGTYLTAVHVSAAEALAELALKSEKSCNAVAFCG